MPYNTTAARGEEEKLAEEQRELVLAEARAKTATRRWSSNSLSLSQRVQTPALSAEEAAGVFREAIRLQSTLCLRPLLYCRMSMSVSMSMMSMMMMMMMMMLCL